MGPAYRSLAAAWLLAAWLVPTPAKAWTEAQVQSLDAQVEVSPDGTALVALELTVQVHGGWLDTLEIAGLDPDFELVPDKPPFIVSADGETKFTPAIRTASPGRLFFSFRRTTSPRRGDYRVGIVYRTDLGGRGVEATDDGHVRVRWTLPGWQNGLDGVRVTLLTPPGAQDAADPELLSTIEAERVETPDRTVLTWQRAHLPRTVPWSFVVDVPELQMVPRLRRPRVTAPRPRPVLAEPLPKARRAPALLVLLIALVALLKRCAFLIACRQLSCEPRPLVPLPFEPLRVLLLLAAATGAAYLWADRPHVALACLCAVVALALERTPLSPLPPHLGAWRVASRAHHRAAARARWLDRLGPLAWFDLTNPLGWLAIGGVIAVVLWAQAAEGVVDPEQPVTAAEALGFLVPLMLTGTRHQLPLSAELKLGRLRSLARSLRFPVRASAPVALHLRVHVDPDGRMQDARIRLEGPEVPEGLLRFDVALGDRRGLGGFVPEPLLVVVSRKGSRADAALALALPGDGAHDAPGGRTARVLPFDPTRPDLVVELLDAIRPKTTCPAGVRAPALPSVPPMIIPPELRPLPPPPP